MRILLKSFAIRVPSIASLRLGDPERLSEIWPRVRELHAAAGVRFFGAGDRLKRIDGIGQLAAEFRKHKVERYSFADVSNLQRGEPQTVWAVGLRRTLLTVTAECEADQGQIETLTTDLLRVNDLLLSSVEGADPEGSWSAIRLPDAVFSIPSPSRDLGRVPHDAVVDVIHARASYREEEREVVRRLIADDSLPAAVRARHGDLLVVRWGDPRRETVETILERRLAWISENGGMPLDSSFNELGDEEFALWNAVATSELTFYSAASEEGAKGVVFDSPDDEDLVETLEHLHGMLASGKTAEGLPLRRITLITPSREDAVALHPSASGYGMPVVYVGADNRFWNPFPARSGGA
jgi:hypothetical protein